MDLSQRELWEVTAMDLQQTSIVTRVTLFRTRRGAEHGRSSPHCESWSQGGETHGSVEGFFHGGRCMACSLDRSTWVCPTPDRNTALSKGEARADYLTLEQSLMWASQPPAPLRTPDRHATQPRQPEPPAAPLTVRMPHAPPAQARPHARTRLARVLCCSSISL